MRWKNPVGAFCQLPFASMVLEKDKVIIETQLDMPFGATEKQALKVSVERYSEFLEVPATLP